MAMPAPKVQAARIAVIDSQNQLMGHPPSDQRRCAIRLSQDCRGVQRPRADDLLRARAHPTGSAGWRAGVSSRITYLAGGLAPNSTPALLPYSC
jgi:hypothetical protein